MKIIFKVIILSFAFSILTAGCGTPAKKQQAQQQMNQDEKQIQIDAELAGKAKQIAKEVQGVKESTAVVINKEITTAVKVSGFDRLRLKPIKNEVHNRIKGLDNSYNVYVTSDKKLFQQIQEIEKEINGSQGISLTNIQTNFNKINGDIRK